MKITTKTGDGGETSLFGGRRVSKSSDFIELVGELDELQAVVGWCAVEALADGVSGPADGGVGKNLQINRSNFCDVTKILNRVVDDLYRMMSIVGFEMKCPGNIRAIDEGDVEFLEGEIESRQGVVENLNKFIRPGTTEIAARLHIARTVCRRAERGVAGMLSVPGNVLTDEVNNDAARFILKYLNRLSDLLFILAYERENV